MTIAQVVEIPANKLLAWRPDRGLTCIVRTNAWIWLTMQIDTRSAAESSAKCLPDFAMREGDAERFWAKVVRREPERCWEWIGARARNGYGMFKIDGKVRTTHRLSLFMATGRFGDVAQHSCDNRACVNPAHLKWSTQSANVADAVAKGRHGQRKVTASEPRSARKQGRLAVIEAKLDRLLAEITRLQGGEGL